MVRGFCSACRREVGGYLKPGAWQCPRCRHLFCENCPKRRVGRIFKKPVCPECGIELYDVSRLKRPWYQVATEE